MPFEKGHKKLGGRKPGTPNKSTWYLDVCRRLEDCDLDLVATAAKLIKAKTTPMEYKVRLLLGLANLAYPKRLAVAHQSRVQHTIDPETWRKLAGNPTFAKAMEAATFELEGARVKALPAPETGVTGVTFTDSPDTR